MVLTITYDLHNPTRNYAAVEGAIKRKAGQLWAHPQGSVWFVDTLDGTQAWADFLIRVGDNNDEFFVARLQRDCSWSPTMDTGVASWLQNASRRW
jgi:hypothetical protein